MSEPTGLDAACDERREAIKRRDAAIAVEKSKIATRQPVYDAARKVYDYPAVHAPFEAMAAANWPEWAELVVELARIAEQDAEHFRAAVADLAATDRLGWKIAAAAVQMAFDGQSVARIAESLQAGGDDWGIIMSIQGGFLRLMALVSVDSPDDLLTEAEMRAAGAASSQVSDELPRPTRMRTMPPYEKDAASLEARALALLTDHPDWSVTRIANSLGCGRTSLYRQRKFKAARAMLKAAGKTEMPGGFKAADGTLEAWNSG
jgi:hypothetical protein